MPQPHVELALWCGCNRDHFTEAIEGVCRQAYERDIATELDIALHVHTIVDETTDFSQSLSLLSLLSPLSSYTTVHQGPCPLEA